MFIIIQIIASNCPSLSIKNGTIEQSQTKIGILAKFFCEEGTTLFGTPVTKCLSNGSWNATKPKCSRNCPTYSQLFVLL